MIARPARLFAAVIALAAMLGTSLAPAARSKGSHRTSATAAPTASATAAPTNSTSAAPTASATAAPTNSTTAAPTAPIASTPTASASADKSRSTKAPAAATTADATAEKPHRVRGKGALEVHARDLKLKQADEDRLRRIADRYHQATRKHLIVTGGTRTPERQAALMIEKLKHGDDILALYEHKAAATEIQTAYREATGRKKRLATKIVADIIRAQMARGIFVSKHLKSGAVDVRSRGMSAAQEKALKEAVKAEAGVTLLDERGGAEPHFHLNM